MKPTTQQVRVSRIEDIVDEVAAYVEKAGLASSGFCEELLIDVRSKEGCLGGTERGRPYVRLSTHDRYSDSKQFAEDNLATAYKRHWKIWLYNAVHHAAHVHVEYASFSKDLTIGSFITRDKALPLWAVICHEIAHAVVYWNYYRGDSGSYLFKPKPHGSEWKYLYGLLRCQFINPRIRDVDLQPEPQTCIVANSTSPRAGTKKAVIVELMTSGHDRAAVIKLAMQQGIREVTAVTYYNDWSRENK